MAVDSSSPASGLEALESTPRLFDRARLGDTAAVGELFETITPAAASAYRFSPADAESVTAALAALTTILDRVIAGEPHPLPGRAPRRPRR